ncbi:hypothetical protein [Alteribacillus sp. YIM 98480]|uniref:hypothetical protein n=1 Tax=Alteribacillus sp. YIM 98480 TaxID=2606599 RepID=UPI00131C617E|nr:hypothetical protein [Alteribacillus sp. YIM 98480]
MSSASTYSLEIPSVRQWKAKISFPYAAPPGVVAREQGACAFLKGKKICRAYFKCVIQFRVDFLNVTSYYIITVKR